MIKKKKSMFIFVQTEEKKKEERVKQIIIAVDLYPAFLFLLLWREKNHMAWNCPPTMTFDLYDVKGMISSCMMSFSGLSLSYQWRPVSQNKREGCN